MIRQLIVARADDFLFLESKRKEDPERLFIQVAQKLSELLGGFNKLEVLGVPSLDWEVQLTQEVPEKQKLPSPDRIVISVQVNDLQSLGEFRKAVEEANDRRSDTPPFPGVGADLSLAESEYFCPTNVDQILFGDRNGAAELTRSTVLKPQGLTGKGVNIVVIDEGFDAAMVRYFGGGLIYNPLTQPLTVPPGSTKRGHGLMMVRNILDAAPDATFYDVPLIPPRISNVTGFIAGALGAFTQLWLMIHFLRRFGIPPWNGPWILVNAWSIFNRATEQPPGDYTENPHHPLNRIIGRMVDDPIDFVFAAGNCGQFCPDRRCGKRDVGPGTSIYGANSHPRVLTTGAVRTDARWAGSSSEGPGQIRLSREKPDLCAPSFFREIGDASLGNLSRPFVGDTGTPYVASTGTSAACGLTAGIVAAIRSRWDQRAVPPDRLRRLLNKHARKTEGNAWNERLGNGIIDVEATLSALP
jgi:hypothetical protein